LHPTRTDTGVWVSRIAR